MSIEPIGLVRQIRPVESDMVGHVVIISDLSSERDGPTTVALMTAQVLRSRNIKVTYVCGDHGDNVRLTALGVRVVPVGGSELRQSNPAVAAVNGLFNRRAARIIGKLVKEIDDEQTIYHIHNWSKILSPSIFLALRPVMHRVVITAHDFFLACPNGGFFNFNTKNVCGLKPLSAACIASNCDRRSYAEKVWRLARDVERRILMRLPGLKATILAVHGGMVEHLVRGGIPRGAIDVLRNPVKPWSSERVPAERNKAFLFVGRLDHDKGADLLAEAARKAGVSLIMAGEGALSARLAAEYPEVKLTGHLTRDQIAALARTTRCVVVPSGSRETFSLVAFEALASGIPIVLSEFAATIDEITEQRVGIACYPYDVDGLAGILGTLARDDDMVKDMSMRAYGARSTLTLSYDAWGDKLLEFYRSKLIPDLRSVATEPLAPVL